ncbi:MAG: matrixin family metalloprotease [Candidatus Gastranaerophilales bacterium]|nr:matrixin family metalloprotease [Candidatus Gastranaerophilales bacterium]
MSRKEENTQRSKEMKISFVIFAIVLLLILGVYYYFKKMLPEVMFNQGKKYYEVGQYEKALKSFTSVANARPNDSEPVYYQALTLSKMPPTYANQKLLYEISQLEDCEQASDLADNILKNMREQLLKQVGPNYIDNVLYEDRLIRWNNSQPITFSIFSDGTVSTDSIVAVKKAFQAWQTATNGTVKFKEQTENKRANICVNFTENVVGKGIYKPELAGKTTPTIQGNTLKRMDVNIRRFSEKGRTYTKEQIYSLALHEIGHALGLSGHSADSRDVMHHTGDMVTPETRVKQISDRDINTLNLLYKMVPNVIDTPLPESAYANLLYHDILTMYPSTNYEAEINRLMKELEKDRKNIIVWVDLAINYAYKKQYARSNHILENALPLVDTDVQNQHVVLYNMAVNYYKLKDYETSERYLVMAKSFGDDFETQLLETFLDVKLNRVNIAKDKLVLMSKQYPENIEIALKLAEIYYKEKDTKEVKNIINRLIRYNERAAYDRRVMKYMEVK